MNPSFNRISLQLNLHSRIPGRLSRRIIPMVYRIPYPWYIEPPTHVILTSYYPWHIEPPSHGILNPLPMVYLIPYPWYIGF